MLVVSTSTGNNPAGEVTRLGRASCQYQAADFRSLRRLRKTLADSAFSRARLRKVIPSQMLAETIVNVLADSASALDCCSH
jgi:hypothetical protein